MQWPEEAASPGIKAIQLGCLLGSLIEEDLCKAEGSCQLAVYLGWLKIGSASWRWFSVRVNWSAKGSANPWPGEKGASRTCLSVSVDGAVEGEVRRV